MRNYAVELPLNCLYINYTLQVETKSFSKSFFFKRAKNINIRTWWKALRKNDYFPADFINFVVNLYKRPASSAIESVFQFKFYQK